MTARAISLREFVADLAADLAREQMHPLRHDRAWCGVYRMRLAAASGDAHEVARLARCVQEVRA